MGWRALALAVCLGGLACWSAVAEPVGSVYKRAEGHWSPPGEGEPGAREAHSVVGTGLAEGTSHEHHAVAVEEEQAAAASMRFRGTATLESMVERRRRKRTKKHKSKQHFGGGVSTAASIGGRVANVAGNAMGGSAGNTLAKVGTVAAVAGDLTGGLGRSAPPVSTAQWQGYVNGDRRRRAGMGSPSLPSGIRDNRSPTPQPPPMNQPQHPVDWPPPGAGNRPYPPGMGEFVPFGKAIPRQPGKTYYTATGVQECEVCMNLGQARGTHGASFWGLCEEAVGGEEYKPMCYAQMKALQGCPEFTNDWCYVDHGGSQVLRAPCPLYIMCHYCLGMNPLHCATATAMGNREWDDAMAASSGGG
jgi:hypothetical protein